MRHKRYTLFAILLAIFTASCSPNMGDPSQSVVPNDSDSSVSTTDLDADSDADADVDGDIDSDADTDTDTDSDSDSNTEVDTDIDSDTDGATDSDSASETDTGAVDLCDGIVCNSFNNEICDSLCGLCVCSAGYFDYGDGICKDSVFIKLQESIGEDVVTLLVPDFDAVDGGISPEDVSLSLETDGTVFQNLSDSANLALSAIISISPNTESLPISAPLDVKLSGVSSYDPNNPPQLLGFDPGSDEWIAVAGSFSEQDGDFLHVRADLTHFSFYGVISNDFTINSLALTSIPEAGEILMFDLDVNTSSNISLQVNGTTNDNIHNGINSIEVLVGSDNIIDNVFTLKITYNYIFPKWTQNIYIDNTTEPDNADELLKRFSPVFYMDEGEEYFPLKIDNIVSEDRLFVLNVNGVNYTYNGAELLSDMRVKGPSDAKILDSYNSLKSYQLTESDLKQLAIYGKALNGPDETVYLQYWAIFPYDKQYNIDQSSGVGELKLEHPLDRERLVLKIQYNKSEKIWSIINAYFAGHLSNDEICCGVKQEIGSSSEDGYPAWSWINGRVNIVGTELKYHCGHPIVYVANGSHAFFPAPREYRITTKLVIPINVSTESAKGDGKVLFPKNANIEVTSSIDNIAYDLITPSSGGFPDFKSLISSDQNGYWLFSGYWIDGPDYPFVGSIDSKLPPFVDTYYSTQYWVENATVDTGIDPGCNDLCESACALGEKQCKDGVYTICKKYNCDYFHWDQENTVSCACANDTQCIHCEDGDSDGHYAIGTACPQGDDNCDTPNEEEKYNWTLNGCANCIDADGDEHGESCDRGADCEDGDNTIWAGCGDSDTDTGSGNDTDEDADSDADTDTDTDSDTDLECSAVDGPTEQSANLWTCRYDEARPKEFLTANPWFQVVPIPGSAETWSVEISQIRVIAKMGGQTVAIIPPGAPSNGVGGGGLYQLNPWFGVETFDPWNATTNADGSLVVYPPTIANRLVHGWGLRTYIPAAADYDAIWTEALVRITGPAQVQVGLDFWKDMDSYFDNTTEDPVKQGSLSNWYGGTGCEGKWVTIASAPNPSVSLASACKGEWVDESMSSCLCEDQDSDGFGVPNCPESQCGYQNDCNDNDTRANPQYPEICGNLKDDDCDSVTDESDCDPPPINLTVSVNGISSLPGVICLSEIGGQKHFLQLDRSGDTASVQFEQFTNRDIEFVLINREGTACNNPEDLKWTQYKWLRDLRPVSFDIRANGVQVVKCSPRTTNTNWQSIRVHIAGSGAITDAGNDLPLCSLVTANVGEGIDIEVDNVTIDPINDLCVTFSQPGGSMVPMEIVDSDSYASGVFLRIPTDGEFDVYEATAGCEIWVRDIWPGGASQIYIGGVPIFKCGARSNNTQYNSLHFNIDAAGNVKDTGDSSCIE